MTRVQVLLREEQDRRLEKLAKRQGVSKASLVRDGVDLVLRQNAQDGDEPLLKLIGQAGRTGIRDASTNHDKYLYSIERRRRQ